jgi:hypothetical protein
MLKKTDDREYLIRLIQDLRVKARDIEDYERRKILQLKSSRKRTKIRPIY